MPYIYIFEMFLKIDSERLKPVNFSSCQLSKQEGLKIKRQIKNFKKIITFKSKKNWIPLNIHYYKGASDNSNSGSNQF